MSKMNNFENIKSMDYKELAEFLAGWGKTENKENGDWESVHEWLMSECRPEDKAMHNVIAELLLS